MNSTIPARWQALIIAHVFLALVSSADAQEPPAPAPRVARPVFSIGQPRIWQPYVDALGVWSQNVDAGGTRGGASLVVGVNRPLIQPVVGALAASGEVYGTAGGAWSGGGLRAFAGVPLIALKTGLDWNIGSGRTGRIDWILSYQSAIRRGGLFGRGSMLRVDWLPTRRQAWGVGVHMPVFQPLAGRTRPRVSTVTLPSARTPPPAPLPPAVDAALATMDEAATLLRVYTSLSAPADIRLLATANAASLRRQSYATVERAYEESLARAFRAAAGGVSSGDRVSLRARSGLFDDVIVPYDALFGQAKKDDALRGLTARAARRFDRWLADSSGIAAPLRPAVQSTHRRWLGTIERIHRELAAERGDSRLIWMPVQLALSAEQYDDQEEVDSLLARVVGRPFTDANALTYLRSSDLPLEIARSIYAARDYHVLWVHDFAGRRESGAVDNVGYEMVADVYFPALTAAVKRYDTLGSLPLYMILIDQFFYEPMQGRLWMTMLADPLHANLTLRGADNASREAHLRERQQELRSAVAASARLQREAARWGGEDWIRQIVKVQVNVTYQADFSFRSGRIVPGVPFTPDNIMRDHRKAVIYDVNEAEPYRGSTILMGVGIGEHYSSATWEDRGYRLRGPATLELRAALRRALRENGYRDDQIPAPLRAAQDVKSTERRANQGDYVGRALVVNNEVGFGTKSSSVARALLYNVAQPGSTLIVPDPLWLSEEWAAMLSAAAVRGARVHVIAPAAANAPSPQPPVLALSHDLMQQLIELRTQLAARLRESGGELRVGIFAAQAEANDFAGIRREIRDGLRRAPWIREVIPFDSSALAVLDRPQVVASTGQNATELARDEKPRPPQLHQKTQLVARPGAIAALVRQPGWEQAIASMFEARARETARFADQLGYETPAVEVAATRRTDSLLTRYESAIPETERKRVSFYFTVGTQNEDTRGLALDGEASLITSGFQGTTGLVDLYFLMARTTWLTTPSEVDRYIPPARGIVGKLSHFFRAAF